MTRLEEIKYEVNCAVLEAIDAKIAEFLPHFKQKTWVLDKHLPALLPAVERATEMAMREVYDLLPESMSYEPEFVEHTRQQLEDSLQRVKSLGHD